MADWPLVTTTDQYWLLTGTELYADGFRLSTRQTATDASMIDAVRSTIWLGKLEYATVDGVFTASVQCPV